METYLTAKEVALLVKLTLQTIRRYTMQKKIPYYKINRLVRYKKFEIELWVEQRKAAKVKKQNNKQDVGLFPETESGIKV